MSKELGHYVGEGKSRYANAHSDRYSVTISRFAEDIGELRVTFTDELQQQRQTLIFKEKELEVMAFALNKFFERGERE